MKKVLSVLMLVYCSHWAIAQTPPGGTNQPQPAGATPGAATPKGNGKITGTVLDEASKEPVPFATIALEDPATGKPVDGAVADDKGKFTINRIAPGTYNLSISFIGYKTVEKSSLVIEEKGKELNLGTIFIASEAKQLKEIVVQGQKDLIEEKVDRTIYNAENDLTTRGGDATDVLKRVPMLSVDLDGNVTMRGSQNIRVLINNKPSTIAANSIADALKQIPAEQIKTVEVITSPSAKYDAEGTGGIINIITKKNNLQGASLNVNGSVGVRGSNLGLNGSYRKGKMGFSLGGFGRSGYNVYGNFDNSQRTINADGSQTLTTQQADTRNNNLFGRYTFGWDYDINKYNSLSASVQYGVRNFKTNQDHLLTRTFENDILQSSSIRNVNVDDLSGTVDVNLNYTHTYETPQREFSILTLYSRNNRTNDFINNILQNGDNSVLSRLKNQNESFNQEITVQADYQTPLGKTQLLEMGGKNITRKVTSDYQYFFAEGPNGPFVPSSNALLGNVFDYDQNVTAGYLSYTLNFLKAYSLKAGARYEYTTIQAKFQEGQTTDIPSYGVLVPSVNISKKLGKGNIVKAAYNRRIQRPSLQYLNPNVQASNPLNITIGNPALQPEYTNNFELSYNTFVKNTSLNFSTFARNTNDAIQSVRDVLGQDTIRTTYQNIGKENAYGFSIFANVNIANKFTLNGGTDMYYAVLNNNVPNPIYAASNQGWVISGRIFGNYNLSKGWGLQLFSFYRGRQVQLQGYQGGFGIYSLSLKKDFNEKKGSIGFGAENFFSSSMKIRNELNTPVISQNSTNVLHNMNFKVTFSYRIGKLSVDNGPRKRRKSVNNDDLKEGGSDNGQNAAVGGDGAAPASGGAPGQTPGAGARPGAAPGQRPSSAPGSIQPQPGDSTGATPGQSPIQTPNQEQPRDSIQTQPTAPVQGQPIDSTQTPPNQKPVPAPGQGQYPNQNQQKPSDTTPKQPKNIKRQ